MECLHGGPPCREFEPYHVQPIEKILAEPTFGNSTVQVHCCCGDITDLKNILVHTAENGRVPLSQLAEIRVENGASIIARRENQRQMTVRTNIRGIRRF